MMRMSKSSRTIRSICRRALLKSVHSRVLLCCLSIHTRGERRLLFPAKVPGTLTLRMVLHCISSLENTPGGSSSILLQLP